MIKKTYLIPVKVNLYCDKCGAEMKHEGIALMSDPPQYPYKCPNCGYSITSDTLYPTIIYEDKHVASDIFQNNMFNI